MAKNKGTLIAAPIRVNDSNDTYPAAYMSEIKGGHFVFESRDDLYAFAALKPDYFEQHASIAYLKDEGKDIRLVDISKIGTDEGWEEVKGGNETVLYYSDVAPNNSLGKPGDIYVRSGGYFYQKIVDNTWELKGQLMTFSSIQISDTLNFTAVVTGKGVHYVVDKANGVLRLNLFPSATGFDVANDIIRYLVNTKTIEFLWKLKLSDVPDGDVSDKTLSIDANGNVRKITAGVTVASDSETQTGLIDNKAVSPLKLKNWWTWAKQQVMTLAETVTFSKAPVLAGNEANSIVATGAGKELDTKYKPIPVLITNTTVQNNLTNAANWDGNGIYTGPAIAGQYQRQIWYSETTGYLYELVLGSLPKRYSIGKLEHIVGNSSAPTVTWGVGAGTTPTGTSIAGNDIAGRITLTTGSAPTADGIICTVTFSRPYSAAPRVLISPRIKAAMNVAYVSNETTTTFVITGTLVASTQYIFNYSVFQ